MTVYWHRFSETWYAPPLDEFENPIGESRPIIRHRLFDVIKETPKGVWLNVYGEKKFVLAKAVKRFACPTEDEAWESFLARKRRQLSILQAQSRGVQKVLDLAIKENPEIVPKLTCWKLPGHD